MSETSGCNLALYGATGALGREVMVALEGQGTTLDAFYPVGSPSSAGQEVYWRGRPTGVLSSAQVDPNDLDAAILAVSPEVSQDLSAALRDADVLVIDHALGEGSEGPLVWPTMNIDLLARHDGTLRLPGPVASTLAPILQTVHELTALSHVDIVALHSAQAFGHNGVQSLSAQTIGLLNKGLADEGPFGDVLAFNVLAHTEDVATPTMTGRNIAQLKLLSGLDGLDIQMRALIVPVFAGLTFSVRLDFESSAPSVDALKAHLKERDDIEVHDDEGPMALRNCLDSAKAHIGAFQIRGSRSLACVVNTDPVYRSAWASSLVLDSVVRHDLW